MANFTVQLGSNAVYASMFNTIISQEVFADNIARTNSKLVDMSRVDGGLYGDRKLFYATDVLKTNAWLNDAEAANLLAIDRGPAPEVQEIVLNQFRQIRLTTDEYLTKQAWMNEGAFASFNSIMLGWLRDTKRVYDSTLFNTFVGTTVAGGGEQAITITLPAEPADTAGDADIEAYNRIKAQTIATKLADIVVELEDVSRDYNDYGFMRSYDMKDLIVVWNSEWANEIKKLDLPTIFHKDGLIDDMAYQLPAKYFGTVNVGTGTAGASTRALVEGDFGGVHLFPGEKVPAGTQYAADTTYEVNPRIAFKIMHKRSVPYMSAFEVGTSFFNPRSLTTNHYLTFGHNTLEYLRNYPFITVSTVVAG